MKIRAHILVGWEHNVQAGIAIKLPIWVDGGTYPDLIEANKAVHVAFGDDTWLSVSIEGFIVHGDHDQQVALLSIVHEGADDNEV